MRRVRYLGRLFGEFLGFAWQNKAWWLVPIAALLLLLMLLVLGGGSLAPFLYPLF